MGIFLKINLCISYSLIFLSSLWFFFVIIINNRAEDPRIYSYNQIKSFSQSFSDGLYLRKVPLTEQFSNLNNMEGNKINQLNIFELIQIMNDRSPNIIGDEVILIISITNQKLDRSSIKFTEYLYNNSAKTLLNGSSNDKFDNQFNKQFQQKTNDYQQIPIYILKQTEPILINNQKRLISYKQQIQQTLNYFINILDIKKLSLLSFQIGALLTLYSLAHENNLEIFKYLNKVVLINPFNLNIKVFHSPPVAFVEKQIKSIILQSQQKFNSFNNLRLIIISTSRTVFHQSDIAEQYFTFSYKKINENSSALLPDQERLDKGTDELLYRFNNTFTISTRSMPNIFCFFDKQIYFFYEPFVSLLSQYFIEDSKKQFLYQQIEYYFHYKQLPYTKELSEKTKRKFISKCTDFNLENYQYNGNTFGGVGKENEQCIRLLRKQSIYYENSSILLYSKDKFEVYGQNFERLNPYESKTSYLVYHIEKINQFRRLFIINRRVALIHLKIAPIFMPQTNPIISSQLEVISLPATAELSQVSFQNLTNFQMIRTCQPANLIFPIHFTKMARFGQYYLLFTKESNKKNCYTEYDNYDFYPDWFLLNWNILRNIIVFTLFASHVLGKNLASRFYTQSLVNQVIIWASIGHLLLFENFIILSTLCVFESFVRYITVGLDYFSSLRKIVLKFMWSPVLLQIVSIYYQSTPSSWKLLMLLIGLSTSKHSIYLIIIKFTFLIDSIKYDMSNLKGIFSICLWNFISNSQSFIQQNEISQKIKNKKNQLKKKIIDMCFMFSIAVCINQDGSVIDEIINAFIVIQTILYINLKWF